MRITFVIVIACLCLLQSQSQAKPTPVAIKIDMKELVKLMGEDCKTYMFNPENQKKLQVVANTGTPQLLELLKEEHCEEVADYIEKKMRKAMRDQASSDEPNGAHY